MPRTISVVIPVRNDAAYLECCLESLARQTRPADEVVVVDNGSDDESRTVAARWGARIIDEPEPGIPAAASAGYDAARGALIARLDADSQPPEDWLERVDSAFESDQALDALTGPGDFDRLGRRAQAVAQLLYMRAYFGGIGRVIGHPPVFGSNFAMTRDAWSAIRDDVHRRGRWVHDDLDLSRRLGGRHTRFDPTLRVTVSARPVTRPLTIPARVLRGIWTLVAPRP